MAARTMFQLGIAVLFVSLRVHLGVLGQYGYPGDAPRVLTNLGAIKGHYKISNKQNIYEAFEGVPYALPPLGELRFEIPVPMQPWSGELVANKVPEPCVSFTRSLYPNGKYIDGTEDCLYMNIYAPVRRRGLLPVIFYIHGGDFLDETLRKDEAHYLIDYDIIYVTMNFRVGVLGHLSTGDDVVPGNMGLKDQSLALKWTQENIIHFGGDPNRVTITGLSTGANSAHLHYLSPLSRGLFRNGISFSGTAFKCWAQTVHAREKAMRIGAALNCPTDDSVSLVQCLKQIPARDLTETTLLFMPKEHFPFTYAFGPVVERPSAHAFMSRSPAEIVRSGDYYDVPWVTGILSDELLGQTVAFAANDTILEDLDLNWEERAPILLDFNYTIPRESQAAVSRRIREHYFGDKPINRENFGTLVYLLNDRLFFTDTVKAMKAQAESSRSPIWLFYYSYAMETPRPSPRPNSPKIHGAIHTDDVNMVVKDPTVTLTQRDSAMQRLWLKLWISVAYEGWPNLGVKWSPVNSVPGILSESNINFLHIAGPNELREEHNLGFAQRSFWNSIGVDVNTQGITAFECN